MVLFANITNNQRVEVLRNGKIYSGTVRYKGGLNAIPGDWVGVDLDKPAGQHDGMLSGRRYFQCRPRHGIFAAAKNIRFVPITRCLYHRYKTVGHSKVDDTLFHTAHRNPAVDLVHSEREAAINQRYKEFLQKTDYLRSSSLFKLPVESPRYPLPHAVGNYIPAATFRRSRTSLDTSSFNPIHTEYGGGYHDEWITSPSIPVTHMPYGTEQKQEKIGWSHAHYPRYTNLNTSSDCIRRSLIYAE